MDESNHDINLEPQVEVSDTKMGVSTYFRQMLSGLDKKKVIPLVALWAAMAVLFVGNRYKVESLMRRKLVTQDRIDLLREKRIELQKQYQESVKISKIAEMLQESEVGITAGPPFEI